MGVLVEAIPMCFLGRMDTDPKRAGSCRAYDMLPCKDRKNKAGPIENENLVS